MGVPAFLGNGILRPFRRDEKNDFANGPGIDLLRATAGQVLGTRCDGPRGSGELPWRGEFGSKLHLLRHKRITATTKELARYYASDALRRWEPRIVVTRCLLDREPSARNALIVRVFFDYISKNVPGNHVILGGIDIATLIT